MPSNVCNFNVFSHGNGKDIMMDHHNIGLGKTYTNLWTDIDVGLGSSIYWSSGNYLGQGWVKETLWDIYGKTPPPVPGQLGTTSHDCNFIACANESARTVPLIGTNQLVEKIDPAQIYPKDIYWAQMKLFHNVNQSIITH